MRKIPAQVNGWIWEGSPTPQGSPKHEIRNPKEIRMAQNSKFKTAVRQDHDLSNLYGLYVAAFGTFSDSSFGFPSCFGFRISNLQILPSLLRVRDGSVDLARGGLAFDVFAFVDLALALGQSELDFRESLFEVEPQGNKRVSFDGDLAKQAVDFVLVE